MLGEELAQLLDVGRLPDEGKGENVDALLQADGRVAAVLFGEGRQVHLHAGQVDVAARRELAGDQHAAANVGVLFLQDFQADEAVVHQHGVAHLDVVDQVPVIDVHRADFARLFRLGADAGFDGEVEDFARLELDRHREVAGADFRAFDVHHDRDLAASTRCGHGADAADDLAGPVMLGVRHVQADDIGAGAEEFLQHLLAFGGGPEREDDVGAADGRSRWTWRKQNQLTGFIQHTPRRNRADHVNS